MKIIVIGSLGNIGKLLTEDLVKKGHDVTVISSKAEKQKDIEALGAAAAIGSLDDAGFLTTTFRGADAVFAMVPPNFAVADSRAYYQNIAGNYAQAVKDSGVQHLVHLSSMGADLEKGTGFILGSHDAEGILNKLPGDIAITHLRPAYFYTNLYSFVDMIKNLGFIAANYGADDRMILAHPTDIAAAAAEELTASATGRNVRYVVSDECVANEIAQVLGEAIGKPDLKWVIVPDRQMLDGMEKNGLPPHVAANFVEMGSGNHTGIVYQDYDLHQPITMGKVKLEDFAKEFAAAFSS